MQAKKAKDIELLLSKLDKEQLCEFIREECANDKQFQQRFLAVGAGIVFIPKPADYRSRVLEIIKSFEGKYRYVEYSNTHGLNRAVVRILHEADEAMEEQRWEVAMAILEGVASAGESIVSCGDDSAGELSGIVYECFARWHELCAEELLPQELKSKIFELSITSFTSEHLKGWDWWWDWIEMAISLADTAEKQERIIQALDHVINTQGNDWHAESIRQTAQRHKLAVLSKRGTPEELRKFMYENVGNPDFRRNLLQMAWDEGNYDEVLRLAKEGVAHDSELRGLVTDWHKWELQTYRLKNDQAKTLELARYFFVEGGRSNDRECSMEAMYALMRSMVPNEEWRDFVDTLATEVSQKIDKTRLLFIYTEEKMWDRYMEYIREAPCFENLDDAPQEVWALYKDELIRLYTLGVRSSFQRASSRSAYREGVTLLRKLIKYGGKTEAEAIIVEQKSRTPRRPALIEELSKLQ